MSRWGASAKRFLTAGNGRWIALFLVVQMAVPASYYLRKDRHDERFSWRMFSTMRMAKCDPEVNVGGARVALGGEFHEAWIELARRGRTSVLEAMAARLCQRHRGQEVVLWLRCTYLDGTARTLGGFDACKVPEL